jgi:transcriptional regulator with XRE-family HTH domain
VKDKNLLLKRLQSYQRKRRLSQEDLARKLDVCHMTINRWLTGKYLPWPEHQKRIEALLNEKEGREKHAGTVTMWE